MDGKTRFDNVLKMRSIFSIRGCLGSFTPLARNIGVLIAYIVGATVEYEIIPVILIYIPILYMICLFLLPNTPQYYLKNDNVKVSYCFLNRFIYFKFTVFAKLQLSNLI